jgi:hypothetical protein
MPPNPDFYNEETWGEAANTNATHNTEGEANAATAATVETIVGSEHDTVFTRPEDPYQILLSQLRPLNEQSDHLETYKSLAKAQVTFCQATQKLRDKVTKNTKPGFVPKCLNLSKINLELPADPKDDPAYTISTKALTIEFQAAKERFQEHGAAIIKQSTEQLLKAQQKRNGKIFMEKIDKIANSSAGLRVNMWNVLNEDKLCIHSTATISYMAVQQLLKESQPKGKLETWLDIPNLSDLHNDYVLPTEVFDENITKETQYATLDRSKGDKGRVDALTKELATYIPKCTYEYTANALRLSAFIGLEGSMKAQAKVLKTRQATAATDKAISRAAAQSDQQASTRKQHPKVTGGQQTQTSKPATKTGSQQKRNSHRNGTPTDGKGKQKGNGKAHAPKRKQQEQSQRSRTAKNQDNENGDATSTPTPSKRRRRNRNRTPNTTTASETPVSRNQQQRVGNQGDPNNGKQRSV